MNYLLNGTEMKQCDSYTIHQIGVSSLVLMERAALGVMEELCGGDFCLQKVLVVCGCGNNGGDGFAVARMLHLKGIAVDILLVGSEEKCTEETAQQLKIAQNLGIPVLTVVGFSKYTTIVDALFGIGLCRNVEGVYADTIDKMNASGAEILAVDIPSGVSTDSGKVLGTAVKAKCTVTFAYAKVGLTLYPGAEFAGKVIVKDIGISDKAFTENTPKVFTYGCSDLNRLPKRNPYSNKGSYGKVLTVAGSPGMSGAAYFSAKAAYRIGAGLVRIYTAEENRIILQTQLPEAIMTNYARGSAVPYALKEAIRWADVIVVGPGIGKSEDALLILQTVLEEAAVPLIVDADALNLISDHPQLLKNHRQEIVITPHLGEMSRLTGKPITDLAEDLIGASYQFANEHNVTCVLKDARSVVAGADGSVYLNCSGNNGMATGGSGDVLTGIIAGLIAQGLIPLEAARVGVYLHGLAGDTAAKKVGAYSMIADDILDAIGDAMKS